MDRFIKESMRLFPTVPFYGRHLKEDAEICGFTIPAGTAVSVNAYMLHRNPDHFPDPETFDPNRFLPENCMNRHPFAYVPFSAGPRNCIGQKFAWLEIRIIVMHFLRRFKIIAVHRLEEMVTTVELVLRPVNGIWLKFEPRN